MAAREEARKLGLKGWVRNMSDGRVEMWLEGTKNDVEAMLDWAHQGPRFAGVTDIETNDRDIVGRYQSFEITD